MPHGLFITGANGFVGRCLLRRLDPALYGKVVCLTRRPEALKDHAGIELVAADLLDSGSYGDALAGCDTVLHLAAVTGKARPAEYFRVNRDGTQALLDQCRTHGVRNFLHVSSIAAGFKNVRRYWYAQSKREAEAAVAASGLAYTIVRPTVILGPGSPVWQSFAKLAKLPVTPVFGKGTAKIQPIDVEDLADCLLALVREGSFRNETLDLGGPEAVGIEEFLRGARRTLLGREARVVHVPLRPTQVFLGLLEPLLLPLLPVTAGQLASFGEDGTAAPNRLCPHDRMKTIQEMLAQAAGRPETRCDEPARPRV